MPCLFAPEPGRRPGCRRANGRRTSAWILALGIAVAASLVAADATAADPVPARHSTAPAVANAGRNVYSAGGQVQPSGPVEGDFVGVGGRVTIDQPVQGDVTVAGGAVDIRAPVGDDLRAAAGDITIAANVAGEALASGGNLVLARSARIGRSATLYGGSVRIDGTIDGRLTARAQRLALNGEVAGDAELTGEQIALGPGVRIGGRLRYASPNEIVRSEGAVIAGPVTRMTGEDGARASRERGRATSGSWFGAVLVFAGVLASGVVWLLVFPRFTADAAQALRRAPGLALLLGFAALAAVPALAVLLFITLLGLPLGIALLAFYPLLLLGGYIIGVYFIAGRAQAALRSPDALASGAQTIGFFALALLLVTLLGRLPWVGGLVVAAVAVLGLGACVLAVQRRRETSAAAAP